MVAHLGSPKRLGTESRIPGDGYFSPVWIFDSTRCKKASWTEDALRTASTRLPLTAEFRTAATVANYPDVHDAVCRLGEGSFTLRMIAAWSGQSPFCRL